MRWTCWKIGSWVAADEMSDGRINFDTTTLAEEVRFPAAENGRGWRNWDHSQRAVSEHAACASLDRGLEGAQEGVFGESHKALDLVLRPPLAPEGGFRAMMVGG